MKIISYSVYFFLMFLIIPVIWGWFFVPLGLPGITPFHAMGLYIILSLLSAESEIQKMDLNKETDKEETLVKSVALMIIPFIWLLMGYIGHFLMTLCS